MAVVGALNKSFLLASFLLITVAFSSSGLSDGLKVEVTNPSSASAPHKKENYGVIAIATAMKTRKLLMDSLQDYEDACANSKHLPGKKPCKNT